MARRLALPVLLGLVAHVAAVAIGASHRVRRDRLAQYQIALAYRRIGDTTKAREHTEIYNRRVQQQKARSMGVRGAKG